MRVLLTGGAGYVGSACLRHLIRNGVEAFAFDNLSQGHAAAVPKDRLIVGDLADEASIEAAMKETRAEAVMHFAASIAVGESVTDPATFYTNNVAGSLNLLQAMRRRGVDRILFSGTCAVYDPQAPQPLSEAAGEAPESPYARTKLAVEWMLRDFAAAYEMGFTVLRYFNASGASVDGRFGEAHQPETHLIPLVLQVPLGQRDEILIFGSDYQTEDGTCVRDYVHVDDLAEAHLLALRAMTVGTREVYNVGTGVGTSVLEVIEACETVVGAPIRQKTVDRRPGDLPVLVAAGGKIADRLGWTPRHTEIRDIVGSAWAWHEAHPRGYATL